MKDVSVGKNAPDVVNVVIEIPANSAPVKYEVCKDSGLLEVDRFLTTAMHYPCDYGYVPNTLCDDGDPIDVCVLAPFSIISGAVCACRPLGVLTMEDEKGGDDKLLAVPDTKIAPEYAHFKTLDDVPQILLDRIGHFFAHYKDLEKNKWAKVKEWHGQDQAKSIILASIDAYKQKS
ncbi:MAG: inorganic diphosphatase [Legionellales bacterium]|nr:inorganic diphosphatase [Legionellales bacterium]OUX64217.1 MAG: inorganic pyrophosphatase [Gammaproteobacteria bacterium TMED281]